MFHLCVWLWLVSFGLVSSDNALSLNKRKAVNVQEH